MRHISSKFKTFTREIEDNTKLVICLMCQFQRLCNPTLVIQKFTREIEDNTKLVYKKSASKGNYIHRLGATSNWLG